MIIKILVYTIYSINYFNSVKRMIGLMKVNSLFFLLKRGMNILKLKRLLLYIVIIYKVFVFLLFYDPIEQSSYVVDTKLLNYMNCYLQRFYTDPSTSLNTILNSLLSQLQIPSSNPNFEMTLLSWLISRHITLTTEEQLTTLFSILSTLCSNPSYLDYLEKAIDLLISSFSMCTVTQLHEVFFYYLLYYSLVCFVLGSVYSF